MRKAKRERIRRFLSAKSENCIFDGISWYKEMKRKPKGVVVEKPITHYSV